MQVVGAFKALIIYLYDVEKY